MGCCRQFKGFCNQHSVSFFPSFIPSSHTPVSPLPASRPHQQHQKQQPDLALLLPPHSTRLCQAKSKRNESLAVSPARPHPDIAQAAPGSRLRVHILRSFLRFTCFLMIKFSIYEASLRRPCGSQNFFLCTAHQKSFILQRCLRLS